MKKRLYRDLHAEVLDLDKEPSSDKLYKELLK
jgi:hypothetical protein